MNDLKNMVQFKPSDRSYKHLEKTAIKIADFLHNNKSQLEDFSTFMRISGTWNLNNYKNNLQKWASRIAPNRKKAAPDTLQLIDLTNEFFSICQNEEDRMKMRGLVPEKIFETIFRNRHAGKNGHFGFGVIVIIGGKPVVYKPQETLSTTEDSDVVRKTVDAGFWDGKIGEFAEVKFSPEAFQTKDINYLVLLEEKLRNAGIPHSIFLVCFHEKELIRFKLKRIGLWEKAKNFYLIGLDELFQLEKGLYA